MSINSAPKFFDLDDSESENVASKYINEINYYLEWYSSNYNVLCDYLKKTNIPIQFVLQVNNLDKDIDEIDKIFYSLENILPYVIEICLLKIKINDIESIINKSIDMLDDDLLINSEICIGLKSSLIDNDFDRYSIEFKCLENIYGKYEILDKRNNLLNKLGTAAPIWASDIRNRRGIHGLDSCPSNIMDAWKFRQLSIILDELNRNSLDELQKRSQELSKKYRKATEKYATNCAWYEMLLKTEGNINIRQALNGWMQTMKKIGKGTGKNVGKYKTEARNLMAICQNAVPCWIMPINKVIESLKPGENQFDVIIIDEASQADISALAISYFGKKLIVVGDDKQVNLMDIGTIDDKVQTLIKTYLNNIPNSHLYGRNTSLYDIAATTFQPLMLKEHFRCVPEIIGFSNMLSYDFKIKPLRDSSSSNLLPAVIKYDVNGKRQGNVNKVEAETIISLIKACLNMDEYKNKTIGVISLLSSNEQVRLIQELMYKYIDQKDIENRKILVGIPSNFQGDERDVIFLSMVDSRDENGGPLRLIEAGSDDSTKKRYNVAVSRAKDQLWVINSLDASSDLKPGDIKKKLLDYATDPHAVIVKKQEIEKNADSVFEEQVATTLYSRGYHITRQYPVGGYRLDIVVICGNKKVAIECDGERYHSGEQKVLDDMQRQTILERIGWTFIRIRGSHYFKDPDKEMERVVQKLESMNIYLEEEDLSSTSRTSELLERIKLESHKYLNDIQQGRKPEIVYEDISYALDSSKNIDILDNTKILNEYKSNKNSINSSYTTNKLIKNNVSSYDRNSNDLKKVVATNNENNNKYSNHINSLNSTNSFLKKDYNSSNKFNATLDYEESDEQLYNRIVEFVINNEKVSLELVRCKFGLGLNRTERMMNLLEERGIVGKENGTKLRDVLVKPNSHV